MVSKTLEQYLIEAWARAAEANIKKEKEISGE